MSFIDAFFGRVQSAGNELELQSALNFQGGLQAAKNVAQDRIDIGLQIPSATSIGHLELTSAATTSIASSGTWYRIAGTFAAGANNGSLWTVGGSGVRLTWGGSVTALVVAVAGLTILGGSGKQMAFGFAIDGTSAVNTPFDLWSDSIQKKGGSIVSLLSVPAGKELELEMRNETDSTDATVFSLSMVLAAFAAS